MAHISGPGWPALDPGGSGSGRGPEQPPQDPGPWHTRRRLWLTIAVITAVGYLAVGVAATSRVYWEFHRKPTQWELYRAGAEEVKDRWRTWPADRIFPLKVPYTPEQGGVEQALRVGIAPEKSCAAGIESAPAAVLTRNGCRALLRATYVDQAEGIVFTVGVAVFPDERTAMGVRGALMPAQPTQPGAFLRALTLPGTVADRFADAARQYATVSQSGPYVVLTTAGQTDGRPAAAVRKKHEEAFQPAVQVGSNVAEALAYRVQPDCSQKRQWKC